MLSKVFDLNSSLFQGSLIVAIIKSVKEIIISGAKESLSGQSTARIVHTHIIRERIGDNKLDPGLKKAMTV